MTFALACRSCLYGAAFEKPKSMPAPKGKLVAMGGKCGCKQGSFRWAPDGLQWVGEILATEHDLLLSDAEGRGREAEPRTQEKIEAPHASKGPRGSTPP